MNYKLNYSDVITDYNNKCLYKSGYRYICVNN